MVKFAEKVQKIIVYLCLAFVGAHSLLGDSKSVYISNELRMPRIGFGTAALGGKVKEMTCVALNSGIRLIDSAQAVEWYREGSVGQAIKDCHTPEGDSELVVVTKVHPRSYMLESMRAAIEKSKIDLYGERRKLDVAILHAPFCWQGHCTREQEEYGWRNGWRNLETIHKEGSVSAIGVSNFQSRDLLEVIKMANTRVAVVQNWMDPFNQDKEVRRICKEYGIAYMAYSSLGGQWEHQIGHNPVLQNPTLLEIAAKHNCSVASVVYSWVLNEDAVVIPRSANPAHISHDAALLTDNRVNLDEEDMERIRMLDGTAR